MNNIINYKVNHKEYGVGVITKCTKTFGDTIIYVDFENEKDKKYVFPEIFNTGILCSLNDDLTMVIIEENEKDKAKRVKESSKVVEESYNVTEEKNEEYRKVLNALEDIINKSNDIDKIRYLSKMLLSEQRKNISTITNLSKMKRCNLIDLLIDKSVKHNEYGIGKISKFIEKEALYISINFISISRDFKYPICFENELIVEDNEIKSLIDNELLFAKEYEKQKKIDDEYSLLCEEKEEKLTKIEEAKESDFTNCKVLETADCILRTNVIRCESQGHNCENITAIIGIQTDLNEIVFEKITAMFCKTCNKYYILNSVFDKIRRIGIPMCKIEDEMIFYGGSYNGNLADESIIKMYGYNVGKEENLSANRRQNILAFIIDNEIMTKNRIIDFITWLRDRHFYDYDKFKNAIEKWDEDICFVEDYKKGEYRKIYVNSLLRYKN